MTSRHYKAFFLTEISVIMEISATARIFTKSAEDWEYCTKNKFYHGVFFYFQIVAYGQSSEINEWENKYDHLTRQYIESTENLKHEQVEKKKVMVNFLCFLQRFLFLLI